MQGRGRHTGPATGIGNGHMVPFNGGRGRTMEIEIDSGGGNIEAQSDLTISDYGDEDESELDNSGSSSKLANRRHSLPLVVEEEGSDEDDGEEKKEDISPTGRVLSSRENLHWQISDNGSISSKTSLKKPVSFSSNRDRYTFKFSYEPRESEREYYRHLFQHAKVEKQSDILPPKEAAQLFLTSGIQSDRLRMIWNMAVLPAPKSAKDTPPPSMAREQFNVAVRLIQLFQNRVTAKDDQLNVSDNMLMAPPFFSGISGVQVAMPWKDLGQTEHGSEEGSSATVNRRASVATANFSSNATTSLSDGDTSTEGGKQWQRRHSIESTESGSPMVPAQPKSVTASICSTDQDKIFRMEQDIEMLKSQVKSLQLEVKSLKEIRQPEQTRLANRQQRGASGAIAPTSFTSEYSDDDDKPTTDVEMYWGNGDRSARSRPTEASAESKTSPMRQTPPSALKTNPTYQTNAPRPVQSTHVRTPRRNIEQTAKSRNFSRNIPRFHSTSQIQTSYSNQSQRSLVENPSRVQNQAGAPPPSRAPASNQLRASLPVNGNVSPQIQNQGAEHRKSTATAPVGHMPMRSRRLSTESSFTTASSRTMSTHQSMFSAPNYPYRDPFPDSRRSGNESASLASQLENVNRQEQLNTLLRQTRQARMRRLSTDSSVKSFVPAQLNRGTSARLNGRPSLQRNSLIQSARHIYRRSGGETEIYQEEVGPSTRAVDLKPL